MKSAQIWPNFCSIVSSSKGESAESALLLGFSLYQLHDNKAAVVQLARAVQLNPNLPTVHTLYAQALKETGDSEGAARTVPAGVEAESSYDYIANIETALLLKQDGKLDEALTCIQHALQVRPGDPWGAVPTGVHRVAEGVRSMWLGVNWRVWSRTTRTSPKPTFL